MKRMLFVASLPTKKVHFNGEVNKSGDIYKLFKKSQNFKIDVINLTHHKLFNTGKMILCALFKKYDVIFVSKCVVGGLYAIKLIHKFGRKSNQNNIYFYWIGNGTNGLEHKTIHLEELSHCKNVIVESESVYEDFKQYRIKSHAVLPCVKPNYDLKPTQKDYSKIDTLKCIYFSRICEPKGLMDAVKAIEQVNKDLGFRAFTLDIAGAPTTDDAVDFEQNKLLPYIKNKDEFTFYGRSFCVTGIETYKRLQQYDLHLFPSRFKQECVPGSIVDMFIAGVPTLASSFPNVKYLLSKGDSYIFEQNIFDSLVLALKNIHKNKDELNEKRIATNNLKNKYNEENFYRVIKEIGII